jgi:hypothetical protein
VLFGLAAAAAVPLLSAPVLAGCSSGPPDPLIALVVQARADAELVAAAEQALRGTDAGTAGTLVPIAAARHAHADRLAAELGDDAPAPPGPDTPAPPAPPAAAALDRVRAALDEAQHRAAAEVPTLVRHRAALVGSVAACCGAYRAVLG